MIPVTEFVPADLNALAIAPVAIVLVAALVGVLVEAFTPRSVRHTTQVVIAVLALAAAFLVLALNVPRITGPTLAGALIMALVGSVRMFALSHRLRKLERERERIRHTLGA